MRLSLALLALLFAAVSFPLADEKPQIAQKIKTIEDGLVEFTTPIDMLCPRTAAGSHSGRITERMAFYKVPGLSVAIINNSKIEWAGAYGTFEAASTSKLVVAALVLHLVEQGVLDMDVDVNEQLTSWKIPENSVTEQSKVTLRLLLTHRAGLNRPDGGFSWEEGSTPTLLQTLNGEAPAQNPPAIIEYVPGTKWQYSNFGYLVIQQLVEDVVGEPFPKIARQTIFEPLGMKSSTFEPPVDTERKENQAKPHDAEGTVHEPELHPRAVANGGLLTTPTDLAIFTNELILAYRGKSNRIISREMADEMFHREVDLDPSILGVPLGEGLGVLLFGKGEDFSFLHPGDNMPGSSCWLMGFPASASGIVVMTNGAMGNLLAMEIVASVINEYDWTTACDNTD